MQLPAIIIFAFLSVSVDTAQQKSNPFLKLKFDKVVIYDYGPGPEKGAPIVNARGELAKSIKKKAQLSATSVQQLNKKLGERSSYGSTTAFCFDPHLGVVYFLKDKIVAHISICFSCNRLRSSIDLPAQKQGKVGEGKEAYYLADGLSKSFRLFLNKLVKANHFSHQIEPGSAFDE